MTTQAAERLDRRAREALADLLLAIRSPTSRSSMTATRSA